MISNKPPTVDQITAQIKKTVAMVDERFKASPDNYEDLVKSAVNEVMATSMQTGVARLREDHDAREFASLQLQHLTVLAMSLFILRPENREAFVKTFESSILDHYLADTSQVHVVAVSLAEGPHGPGCTCDPEEVEGGTEEVKH